MKFDELNIEIYLVIVSCILVIKNILQTAKNFVLDTLFPMSCISCGCDGFWLCEKCFKNIELLSFQVCPQCENIITDSGIVCRECKTLSPLDGLLAASKYKENNIDRLVHLYKYRFIEDLHIPLGKILVNIILQSNFPIPDIIVPVPLHRRRLRWRGFNQSELLADYISENLTPNFKIPIEKNLLLRKKYTSPQMKIKKYAERLKNLQNVFEISPSYHPKNKSRQNLCLGNKFVEIKNDPPINLLRGKTILLVDDIATTGATLFECAKILKQNGAKKVWSAVVARQEIK